MFMALIYGVFTLDYVLYNDTGNDDYDTHLIKMKQYNNPIILNEYYPTINVPTAPVRLWLKKLKLWYGKPELNSFDNHGYQTADSLYTDLNGFYHFYAVQRYFTFH